MVDRKKTQQERRLGVLSALALKKEEEGSRSRRRFEGGKVYIFDSGLSICDSLEADLLNSSGRRNEFIEASQVKPSTPLNSAGYNQFGKPENRDIKSLDGTMPLFTSKRGMVCLSKNRTRGAGEKTQLCSL